MSKRHFDSTMIRESQETRDFMANILERLSDGFVAFDAQMNYIYVNQRGGVLLGRKPEDLIGKNYWAEFPEAKGTPFAEAYVRAKETQTPVSIENYYVPWDRWFENRIYPSPEGLAIFFRDITEQKRTEEALRESEARLRLATEGSDTGLWDWDLRSNEVYFSPIWKRQIGYEDYEIPHRFEEWQNRIHPDDRARALATLQAYIAAPWPNFENEFRFRHKDGSYRWILAKASLLTDEQGQPLRIFGSHLDITERKQTEEALRESEAKFSDAFHSNPAMLILSTLEGKNVDVNQAYADFLGFSREEIIGKSIVDLQVISAEEREHVVRLIQQRGGAVRNVEFSVRLRDGNLRHCLFSTDLISVGGVPHRLTTMLDITERKRAEEELKESRERLRALSAHLQSAREEEGTRIARELHDELGGTLTSLRWDLETIDKTLARFEPGTARAALHEKIKTMTQVIDETINTVRRISSELRPSILDDLGLLAALGWQARQFQTRTGLLCQFTSALDELNLSHEQATAIFRIFQEILTNVLRHARASRIDVCAKNVDDEFVLEVQDDGQGFDLREKLSLGALGLVGMRERANLIGGSIEITSARGQGTKVAVHLPLPNFGF